MRRTVRRTGRATIGALLFLLAACADRDPAPLRPDIVVIVVDTLRADRLPFYGCPLDTAPFLDELARRSLVFENAWSPSSWTLPATVSVLTSVHPFQHGVSNLVGLELGPGDEPVPVNVIPDGVRTLAESLRAAGYRTYGLASNVLVGPDVGFDRGFDRFAMLEDEPADVVNARLAEWRDELLAGEPFFLYLHYFDPHDPFHARDPWFDRARAAGETGWPDAWSIEGAGALAELDWIRTRLVPGPEGLVDRSSAELSADELRGVLTWMKAAYDSEIGYVDAHIRDVFEMLALDDAVVVFLADHGEEFFEHGDLTHGFNLYGESVRVPLLLHQPGEGAPAGRVVSPVSTLDVAPTLLRLAGLPASAQHEGVDLLASVARPPVIGTLPGLPEDASAEVPRAEDLRAIVVGDHRLIATRDGRVELYDVARDPRERRDLAGERPDVVAALLAELERIEGAARPFPRTTRLPVDAPSDAMLEHLRGIGYLGGK